MPVVKITEMQKVQGCQRERNARYVKQIGKCSIETVQKSSCGKACGECGKLSVIHIYPPPSPQQRNLKTGTCTAGSARRPTAAAGSYVAVARAHESGSFCAKCWRMVPHASSAAEADGKRRKIFVKIP